MLNGLYYDDETGAEQYFADCEKANNYIEEYNKEQEKSMVGLR